MTTTLNCKQTQEARANQEHPFLLRAKIGARTVKQDWQTSRSTQRFAQFFQTCTCPPAPFANCTQAGYMDQRLADILVKLCAQQYAHAILSHMTRCQQASSGFVKLVEHETIADTIVKPFSKQCAETLLAHMFR